jgi:short-subunit dehydrogenase
MGKEDKMQYRTAIVTGASRGLGPAIARAFAVRGLNVMLAARSEEGLRDTIDSLEMEHASRVAYNVTDLRSTDSIQGLFAATRARFGAVDVLVNNAASQPYKPLVELSDQEIIDTVNVNLTALILCSKLALGDMLTLRRGLIVNIGSDLSRRYLPNMATYVGTKFGVLGFGQSLLREVKSYGIKVCTILPGMIENRYDDSSPMVKEEAHAMRPQVLAGAIAQLLDQPDSLVYDEIMIHPMLQDF